MATYAIGDVQGCFVELERLLDEIRFDAARDRLWFVGDLVNRGPQSAEVLRFVKSLGDRAVTVLGNHDIHLFAHVAGYGKKRADDSFGDVLAAPDCDALVEWLRARPMMHVERGYAMVHAGLLPAWSIERALELAAEVESALRAPDYRTFLAGLYGSQPDRWRDGLRGVDRLRVVVNAMTRMRFVDANGVMDFRSKGELENAPRGYLPWFDVPGRASADVPIVCGHWSALGLLIRPDLLALDSGCVWGGRLTAVRLDDRSVFQVACQAAPAPKRRQ
ncbi:MAG: symmetrical bis(5'-nucleosyl)-tetraphosphatase [Burkholderiales bacterium]